MKTAIITDTHFGARQDNISILDFQQKFLDEVFFPTLQKEKIKKLYHLGDLVDRRKYINFNTASRMRTDFLDQLAEREIEVSIIPGNHDIYYKNSIYINALTELLQGYSNIKTFTHPIDSDGILFLPWICEENHEECISAINNSNSNVLFGHLELNGFEMHKGIFCDHGQDPNLFNKFDLVCSGHFHHKSTYRHINYLGSPWETTWSDFGDTKGFHIFDTNTLELKFIENKFKLFNKIKYNDIGKEFSEVLGVDFTPYTGTYVKVIVQEKSNPFIFDQFITKLEEAEVIDVQVVDDHLYLGNDIESEIINEAESTIDILNKSLKGIGLNKDIETKLESLLRNLYNEANLLQA